MSFSHMAQSLGPHNRFGLGLSDEDLREYEFVIGRPESIPNYKIDKSNSDIYVRTLKAYSIPHMTGSREGMVWCCYCQECNHYDGRLVGYESGAVRSVGWKCARDHLKEIYIEGSKAFQDQMVRARELRNFDLVKGRLTPLLQELRSSENSQGILGVKQINNEMRAKMPGLYKKISEVANAQDAGLIKWEEKIVDYEHIERSRSMDGDDIVPMRVEQRQARLTGYDIFVTSDDPLLILGRCIATIEKMAEFYSADDTNGIATRNFRESRNKLKSLLADLRRIERTSRSVIEFFRLENLRLVAEWRNRHLATPAYSARSNALLWRDDEGALFSIELPAEYRPVQFAKIEDIERVFVIEG